MSKRPIIKVSTSTSAFNKSFLVKIWDERHDLQNFERRGFAQFFYLTLCGHIESLLAKVIAARIYAIRLCIPWDSLEQYSCEIDGITQSHSVSPLAKSVLQLIERIDEKVGSAAPAYSMSILPPIPR